MSGTLRFCTLIGSHIFHRNGTITTTTTTITNKLLLNNTNNRLSPLLINTKVAQLVTVAKQTEEDGFKKNIKPFPYKTKQYTRLHVNFPILDPTEVRMNKNSKIVCVEGNISCKKSDVAKGIAEAFGLHYMPEPRIEDMYINHDGFDYRTLNQYIHPKLHAIDEKMYYENPNHPAVPWMKMFFYQIRYMQYVDALAHLFNTGQGICMERSVQSDFVFAEAMYKCGFLPKDAYDFYFRLRYDTIHHLKRPHLVIYLDTDVDVCLKRIKEKNIDYLSNTKVLTKEYLSEIEQAYKRNYLEDANRVGELLIFKWNQPVPLDDMIREIEKVNLDDWDCMGPKFRDWNFYVNKIMHESRYMYTSEKFDLIDNLTETEMYDVDSLWVDGNDYEHRDAVYQSLVPNYGILPKEKSLTSILTHPSKISLENYNLRAPFY